MSERPELTWHQLERLGEEISAENGMWSESWNSATSHARAFNDAFIESFRANEGRIPGELADINSVLLTVTGARTGAKRVVPLIYFSIDNEIYVIASGGAAAKAPPWYYNVKADPEVIVETGAETYPALASILGDDERVRIWAEIVRQFPTVADHETHAGRAIPVIRLVRQ